MAETWVGALRLRTGIGCEGILDSEPLIAVLNWPSKAIEDEYVRWMVRLIVAARSACRLIAVGGQAGHADEHPTFPVVLLRATLLDIQGFLESAVEVLSENG